MLEIGYDALGRRVRSAASAAGCEPFAARRQIRHVYSGLKVIQDYAVTSEGPRDLAREFVWGGSFTEPVALIDHTDAGALPADTKEVLHYLTGALGSVVALTDAAGPVVERYAYDPYGKTYIIGAGGTKRYKGLYTSNTFAVGHVVSYGSSGFSNLTPVGGVGSNMNGNTLKGGGHLIIGGGLITDRCAKKFKLLDPIE